MMGANKSLLTLRLDNNPFIAGEGIMDLCLGLRTNKTLKVHRVRTGICFFGAWLFLRACGMNAHVTLP